MFSVHIVKIWLLKIPPKNVSSDFCFPFFLQANLLQDCLHWNSREGYSCQLMSPVAQLASVWQVSTLRVLRPIIGSFCSAPLVLFNTLVACPCLKRPSTRRLFLWGVGVVWVIFPGIKVEGYHWTWWYQRWNHHKRPWCLGKCCAKWPAVLKIGLTEPCQLAIN